MSLIGISGKKMSGKDTVAHMINRACTPILGYDIEDGRRYAIYEQYKFQYKKFADKLKDMVCLLLGCTRAQLENQEFKESPLGDEWDNLTPRKVLQLFGTEGVRKTIHPDIWVNALFADYNPERTTDSTKWNKPISNWIIPDVRFPNEAERIKKLGGTLIRVERRSLLSDDSHPSETALDDYTEWDYVIENDGTLQDLKNKVQAICTLMGIVSQVGSE